MTGSQGMKKKEDIAHIISNILEEATKTRAGFTPDVVQQFYEEGRRASQRREEQRTTHEETMREVPRRQLNVVVSRREEAEQRAAISPHMTQRAIEAAIGLGERIELASQGRRLSLRDWVTG